MIKALENALGVNISDPAELRTLVTDFYKSLYTSAGVSNVDQVLQHVPTKVTQSMNEALVAPYTREEVKTALFQMAPTKAPGLRESWIRGSSDSRTI